MDGIGAHRYQPGPNTSPTREHCGTVRHCAHGQPSSNEVVVTRTRATGYLFDKDRACKKLRVHMVMPSIRQETLPDPKYRDAIQAATNVNSLMAGESKFKSPQAFTHHQTQTEPGKEPISTQTSTDACTNSEGLCCEASPCRCGKVFNNDVHQHLHPALLGDQCRCVSCQPIMTRCISCPPAHYGGSPLICPPPPPPPGYPVPPILPPVLPPPPPNAGHSILPTLPCVFSPPVPPLPPCHIPPPLPPGHYPWKSPPQSSSTLPPTPHPNIQQPFAVPPPTSFKDSENILCVHNNPASTTPLLNTAFSSSGQHSRTPGITRSGPQPTKSQAPPIDHQALVSDVVSQVLSKLSMQSSQTAYDSSTKGPSLELPKPSSQSMQDRAKASFTKQLNFSTEDGPKEFPGSTLSPKERSDYSARPEENENNNNQSSLAASSSSRQSGRILHALSRPPSDVQEKRKTQLAEMKKKRKYLLEEIKNLEEKVDMMKKNSSKLTST